MNAKSTKPKQPAKCRHDYVFVPPGVRHSFTNNGTVPLVFLVVTTPVEDEETPV